MELHLIGQEDTHGEERERDRQTDRQTGRQAGRQADRDWEIKRK